MSLPSFPFFLTLLDGLLAGLFIGSSMVEHAARKLGAPFWIAYKQAKESVFAPVMPILFNIGLVMTVASAYMQPRPMHLAAAVLMLIVLVITVGIHLPLNKRFQTWSLENYPPSWDMGRRQWRTWNFVRTALMIVAYIMVLFANA